MTSKWAWWCFKSPASPMFTQLFIRAQIKENIKAPCHWSLCGEFIGTGEFPAQMASNAENVSISWRHHMRTIWILESPATWLFVDQFAHSDNEGNIIIEHYSPLWGESTIPFTKDQGWGLLSQFPAFPYFPNFSVLSKHMLVIEYHVCIWQVLPQISCGGTCQI